MTATRRALRRSRVGRKFRDPRHMYGVEPTTTTTSMTTTMTTTVAAATPVVVAASTRACRALQGPPRSATSPYIDPAVAVGKRTGAPAPTCLQNLTLSLPTDPRLDCRPRRMCFRGRDASGDENFILRTSKRAPRDRRKFDFSPRYSSIFSP